MERLAKHSLILCHRHQKQHKRIDIFLNMISIDILLYLAEYVVKIVSILSRLCCLIILTSVWLNFLGNILDATLFTIHLDHLLCDFDCIHHEIIPAFGPTFERSSTFHPQNGEVTHRCILIIEQLLLLHLVLSTFFLFRVSLFEN